MFAANYYKSYQESDYKKQKINPNKELDSNLNGALVNETVYPINKSKSKLISIGFSIKWKYEPVIKLQGLKNNQFVIFDENQWLSFINNQGVMLSFINSNTVGWQPIQGDGYEIHFVFIGDSRVIKITQESGCEIFLGEKTINEAVNLGDLVKYRYDLLKSQQFANYYYTLVAGVSLQNGDPIKNIYDIILPLRNTNSLNVCCLMQLLHFYPNVVIDDVEIC